MSRETSSKISNNLVPLLLVDHENPIKSTICHHAIPAEQGTYVFLINLINYKRLFPVHPGVDDGLSGTAHRMD